jgi:hypothetical protein
MMARHKSMNKRSVQTVREHYELIYTLRLLDEGVARSAPAGFNNAASAPSMDFGEP